MPTTRFETTIKALRDKAGLTSEAGIKNIDGWLMYLKDHDASGMKSIVADLEKLKNLLGAEELDGTKIKQLVVKLGKETVALGKGDIANASHVEQLGTALEHA